MQLSMSRLSLEGSFATSGWNWSPSESHSLDEAAEVTSSEFHHELLPCKAYPLFITSPSSMFLGAFAWGLPFIKVAANLPLNKSSFPSPTCLASPFPLLSFQQTPGDSAPCCSEDRMPRCLPSLTALFTQRCPTCGCGSYYGRCELSDAQPPPLQRTPRLSPPFCKHPHFPNEARQKLTSLPSTSLGCHTPCQTDQAPVFVTNSAKVVLPGSGTADFLFVCLFPF